MAIIKDGATGFTAGVNSANQLLTHAVTFSGSVDAASRGIAWNLNTGDMTITADATLMYIKNTSKEEFFIERLVVAMGDGITYTDYPHVNLLKNPTGGDVITDETDIDMNQKRNFAFSDKFSGDVFKGKVGGTVTGGDGSIAQIMIDKNGSSIIPVNYILPEQASMVIDLTLNGSGSAEVYAAIVGYYHNHHS